jgi:hypothetical protein
VKRSNVIVQAVGIAFLFMVLFGGVTFPGQSFSVLGTSSNFEGPKGTFYGVQYKGSYPQAMQWYNTAWGVSNSAGSLHSFGTTMKFDADKENIGKPNIFGEMTSIYLPTNTVGNIKPWVPTDWLNQMQYVNNPIGNYSWQIGDKYYGMQTWVMRWYLAFSAEWEGNIDFFNPNALGEIPQIQIGETENNYNNLEVWLEVNTAPTWYYQNAEKTYFALGKVQLSNGVDYNGHTNQNGGLLMTNSVPARSTVSIMPESQSSLLYMYNAPFGDSSAGPQTQYSFEGQALNPEIFKDKSYLKIDMNKFGIYGGSSVPLTLMGGWVQGDVAVVCLDVTVFTIGEWQVQDVQNDPSNYGRFVRTDVSGDFLGWLFAPATLAWLIPVGIFLIILLFFPWMIVALVALFK